MGACYCNNDDFADAILTAPDLDDNTGGAFVVNGTAGGLTTMNSTFLRSPFSLPGGRSGFSVATGGTPGNFLIGMGSPFDERIGNPIRFDTGAVDFFRSKNGQPPAFLGQDLGTKLKGGRNEGDRYGATLGAQMSMGHLFFFMGAPGAEVGGKDNAGALLSARVNDFQNGLSLGSIKTFTRNNLKGSTSVDDAWAVSYTYSRLVRPTGP